MSDQQLPEYFTVLDAGARGGFRDLPQLASQLNMHAFEPDAVEATRISQQHPFHALKVHASALAQQSGQGNLYLARRPSMSSLLEPDFAAFEQHFGRMADFPEWKADLETVSVQPVPLRSIDDWAKEEQIDFLHYLKLDTQGSELDVLRGAQQLLREARVGVIRTEVAFLPVYKQQAIFSSLDLFLKANGFFFVDCRFYPEAMLVRKKVRGKYTEPPRLSAGGDAVYVLNPMCWAEPLCTERAHACAVLLTSLGYGSTAASWWKNYCRKSEAEIEILLQRFAPISRKNQLRRWMPPVLVDWWKKFRR